MVRVTTINRAGEMSSLDVPGSIAGVARVIAAGRRGVAVLELVDRAQARVRITDIVLVQLLDGDLPVVPARATRSP